MCIWVCATIIMLSVFEFYMNCATNEIIDPNFKKVTVFIANVRKFVQKCNDNIDDDSYYKYLLQLRSEIDEFTDANRHSNFLIRQLNQVYNEVQQLINYQNNRKNNDYTQNENIFISYSNNIDMNKKQLNEFIRSVINEEIETYDDVLKHDRQRINDYKRAALAAIKAYEKNNNSETRKRLNVIEKHIESMIDHAGSIDRDSGTNLKSKYEHEFEGILGQIHACVSGAVRENGKIGLNEIQQLINEVLSEMYSNDEPFDPQDSIDDFESDHFDSMRDTVNNLISKVKSETDDSDRAFDQLRRIYSQLRDAINNPRLSSGERSELERRYYKILQDIHDVIGGDSGAPEKFYINENRTLNTRQTALIQKWLSEMGARSAAIRMIDSVLKTSIGLTSADLPDTSTFADGVDGVEAALKDGDFAGAYNIAYDTASEMVSEEGGEGLMECGSWAEATQHPNFKHVIMKEVAPPGMENWIKSNKERFIKQYHNIKKAMSVLYATAWKMFYKNKKKNEAVVKKTKTPRKGVDVPLNPNAISFSISPEEQALAGEKIKQREIGYYTPPHSGVKIKVPIYAVYPDKGNGHCYMVLKKHVDGSPVFIRIPKKDYISKTNEVVGAINESDDSKLTAMERKKLNNAISARGELSGNIRYKQHGGKSKALALLTQLLNSMQFKLHMVSGDEILGDKGSKKLTFSRMNDTEITNSFVVFNYENLGDMENPNFEITVYVS